MGLWFQEGGSILAETGSGYSQLQSRIFGKDKDFLKETQRVAQWACKQGLKKKADLEETHPQPQELGSVECVLVGCSQAERFHGSTAENPRRPRTHAHSWLLPGAPEHPRRAPQGKAAAGRAWGGGGRPDLLRDKQRGRGKSCSCQDIVNGRNEEAAGEESMAWRAEVRAFSGLVLTCYWE